MLDSYLTHIVFISTFCLSKKWSKKDSPSEAPATAPANPNVPTCRALPIFHAEPAKSQPFSKKSVGALVAQANGGPILHALPRDALHLSFMLNFRLPLAKFDLTAHY
jgi:hypothetical protein